MGDRIHADALTGLHVSPGASDQLPKLMGCVDSKAGSVSIVPYLYELGDTGREAPHATALSRQ